MAIEGRKDCRARTKENKKILHCFIVHSINGFPVYPSEHMHCGVWLTTLHCALAPQVPGQGSLHFWLIHARWLEHSLLLTHSGLQFGGVPTYSGRQEQEGVSPDTLHCE